MRLLEPGLDEDQGTEDGPGRSEETRSLRTLLLKEKTADDSRRPLMRFLAAAVIAVLLVACSGTAAPTSPPPGSASPSAGPAHWSYEGEDGPEHWGELDPAYSACADGSAQTPIDVVDPSPADLVNPEFDYQAGEASVVNNGHTIQANAAPGNVLTLDGSEFPLAQLHFHAPSEHTINGQAAPVEVHFVHKTAAGVIAVVGVMLTEGGAANTAWEPFVGALTVGKDQTQPARLDWRAMLPASGLTIRYAGSLTTPPCTEGVHWLLMKETVELSADQIRAFAAAYEGNNRPIQQLNGRTVETDSTP
jgi:carbonic anhydrase